jgi:hypothetical protein
MLVGCLNTPELSVTGLAFGPVIIIVKVFIELVPVRVFHIAVVTFVHPDEVTGVAEMY